ncbi:MAG: shikimate kinase [Rhodothermales bacterium]|nr:shikimate kinase [Rhodothermales bacterium]
MSEPKILRDALPRIYLTGFMGSGKSTLGAALATRLGYDFVDLDERIVERIGMPIAPFFKQFGEAAFRWHETEALYETAERAPLVVAVGGGALVSEDNLAFALAHGLVVYLHVEPAEIVRRLRAEPNTRPMLLDPEGHPMPEALVSERITRLMTFRDPIYRRAHLTVDVGPYSVDEGCRQLDAQINGYVSSPSP